jgi:triosephosphate isomerase
MTPGIKPLIAGNWKMNGLAASLGELAQMAEGHDAALRKACDLLVCVPATLLRSACEGVKGTSLAIGAQDCHPKASGAHTGDISAEMIADCGASAVIVGHSERRTDHGESSEMVRAKAEAALRAGLLPVICIGETLEEREARRTLDVLDAQLAASVPDTGNFVIAYEPVWAIGTGRTATVSDIGQAHAFLRERLAARFGEKANSIRLLYGGSVKPDNAAAILAVDHVDGALVGGASLKAADLLAIARGAPEA